MVDLRSINKADLCYMQELRRSITLFDDCCYASIHMYIGYIPQQPQTTATQIDGPHTANHSFLVFLHQTNEIAIIEHQAACHILISSY